MTSHRSAHTQNFITSSSPPSLPGVAWILEEGMDTVSMDTANSNVLHIVMHTVLQVWDKKLQYMQYSMLQYSFLASIRKYPGIHATPGVLWQVGGRRRISRHDQKLVMASSRRALGGRIFADVLGRCGAEASSMRRAPLRFKLIPNSLPQCPSSLPCAASLAHFFDRSQFN